MAKKATPKKAGTTKSKSSSPARGGGHGEGFVEHLAQELEARFLEGAEMATETTSAETNIALAALGAIEGPHDVEPKAKNKAANAKRKSPRSKAR
jgi:hypothetical protein